MKKFELDINNFEEQPELHIIHLYNKTFLKSYTDTIELLIRYFNQEYKWDGMFNIDDVFNRINNGDNLFILYLNRNAIGYVWFKEMDKTTCYLYNLYVTNIVKRPEYSPIWFVNKACSHMLKYYKKIQCECEDWHSSAQNTFISNGFNPI
jgi:hypothetical protein